MKYPLYNKVAYVSLFLIDSLLKLLPKRVPPIYPPKKILLCNCARLGDMILTTSLFAPLKAAYPNIEIGILCASASKPVIQSHPSIRFIHTLDHWKIFKNPDYFRARKKTLSEIKTVGYDVSIDCNFHFPNMSPLQYLAKIPVRIGFESAGFGPLLTHPFPWSAKEDQSAVEAFFSLACCLPGVYEHRDLLKPNLGISVVQKKSDALLIHMGTSDEKKEWPLSHWKKLAEKLTLDGYRIAFTGKGVKEKENILKLIADFPNARNLCDQLNWNQFVLAIRNASLLIGVDSSAGHIAAAVGTPSVLLYTSQHPPCVWRPVSSKTIVLRTSIPCSPCFTGCKEMSCIKKISVENVYEAVKSIMPRATLPLSSS